MPGDKKKQKKKSEAEESASESASASASHSDDEQQAAPAATSAGGAAATAVAAADDDESRSDEAAAATAASTLKKSSSKKKKKSSRAKSSVDKNDDNAAVEENSEDLERALAGHGGEAGAAVAAAAAAGDDSDDEGEKAAAGSSGGNGGAGSAGEPAKLLRSKSGKSKIATKSVSKDDEKFCTTLLARVNDAPRHLQWVAKINPRGEVQQRLICVGKYRIYSIKKKMIIGTYSVAREAHFFDLEEIQSNSADEVVLRFTRPENREKFLIDCEGDGVGTAIVQNVYDAFQSYSHNFPPRYCPQFNVVPASRLQKNPTDSAAQAIAAGFIPTYKAFCNYYDLPVADDFIAWIEQLFRRKQTALMLDEFGGNYRLKPIVSALKHNTFFTSIHLSDCFRETAVSAIAVALIKNVTLQRVHIANVEAKFEGFEALGKVLRGNQRNVVAHFDFTTSQMTDRGALPFAAGLLATQHNVYTLRLGASSLTAVGVGALVDALVKNNKAFASLQVLDLSGNPLQAATPGIASWIGSRSSTLSLDELRLGGGNVGVAAICDALLKSPIVNLDVSRTPIDDSSLNSLRELVQRSSSLRRLSVAHSSLNAATLLALPKAASSNASASRLFIDVSGNQALCEGSVFADFLQLCESASTQRRLAGVGLSHCAFTTKDFTLLCSSLASKRLDIMELSLSVAMPAALDSLKSPRGAPTPTAVAGQSGGSILKLSSTRKALPHAGQTAPAAPGAEARCGELVGALKSATQLRRLSLAGPTPLGEAGLTVCEALKDTKLHAFDIAGHLIGDRGSQIIADCISASRLRCLLLDDNNLSNKGFTALRQGIKNSRCVEFKYPVHDMHALNDSLKDNQKERELLRDTLDGIKSECLANAIQSPLLDDEDFESVAEVAATHADDGEDDDDNDGTKTKKKKKSSKKEKKAND